MTSTDHQQEPNFFFLGLRDIRENLSLEVMLSDTTNSLLPIEIQNLENRPTCP